MSGPLVTPFVLMLAIGFAIDIVLAILGINVFKTIRRRLVKTVPKSTVNQA